VCTIQSSQTLDALIKYVAQYRILYSDQLELRLSVYSFHSSSVNKLSTMYMY